MTMKWFHLSLDTSVPGPVWASIFWQSRHLLHKATDLVPLSMPVEMAEGRKRSRFSLRSRRARRLAGRDARRVVEESLDPGRDNVLEVHGISTAMVRGGSLLEPIWDRFSRRVLTIVDTIEPEHIPSSHIRRFDLVRCFCPALARRWRRRTDVPVLFQPTGIDALDFLHRSDRRPIDMIVVGRRDPEFHEAVRRHYLNPETGRLLLDFGTRPQGPRPPEDEWRLLMATYARSKIAFCFEPSANLRFKGRSSMTHRWPQAWAAGCTVVGRRPTEPELAPYLDWPESTLEIPDDRTEWIPYLESVLDDEEGLSRRRHRNTLEVLRRHDGRLRLRRMLEALDLDIPKRLRGELQRLEATIVEFERVQGLPPLAAGWDDASSVVPGDSPEA
ncbi:MAG: glycosyltransferase [Planctomycetota bacterium]|jgi:hypothetical protein